MRHHQTKDEVTYAVYDPETLGYTVVTSQDGSTVTITFANGQQVLIAAPADITVVPVEW